MRPSERATLRTCCRRLNSGSSDVGNLTALGMAESGCKRCVLSGRQRCAITNNLQSFDARLAYMTHSFCHQVHLNAQLTFCTRTCMQSARLIRWQQDQTIQLARHGRWMLCCLVHELAGTGCPVPHLCMQLTDVADSMTSRHA